MSINNNNVSFLRSYSPFLHAISQSGGSVIKSELKKEVDLVREICKLCEQGTDLQAIDKEIKTLPEHVQEVIATFQEGQLSFPNEEETRKTLSRVFKEVERFLDANYSQLTPEEELQIVAEEVEKVFSRLQAELAKKENELKHANIQKEAAHKKGVHTATKAKEKEEKQAKEIAELKKKLGETDKALDEVQKIHVLCEQKIKELEQGKKAVEVNNEKLHANITELQLKFSSAEQEQAEAIQSLQTSLSEKEEQFISAQKAGVAYERRIKELEDTVLQKEKAIEGLDKLRIQGMQKLVSELEAVRGEKTKQAQTIQDLQKKVGHADEIVAEMKKVKEIFDQSKERLEEAKKKDELKIQEKDRLIIQLKEQLSQLQSKESAQQVVPVIRSELTQPTEEEFAQIEAQTPEQSFADYVREYYPNHKLQTALDFVGEGRALVQQISKGEVIIPNIRKHHLAAIDWYMYYRTVCQGDQFEQGCFVVRNPGNSLINFVLQCEGVYERKSTHFQDRLLPTFFKGKEQVTTYGIDISTEDTDNKLGLPAGMRTLNFAPIKSLDGLDWAFFKPETWGLSDWGQFVGHAYSYVVTRPAHLFSSPHGPNTRKEHVPPDILKEFLKLYSEATKGKPVPEEKKPFGIAGMKHLFEQLQIDNAVVQQDIVAFLNKLRQRYDHLNIRNGDEVVMGESFLNGTPPKPRLHESLLAADREALQIKDAHARIKTAVHPKELVQGLQALKNFTAESKTPFFCSIEGEAGKTMIENNFKPYRKNDLFDKEKLFGQINKDLNRKDNSSFLLNNEKIKTAEELYAKLWDVKPFADLPTRRDLSNRENGNKEVSKEDAILNFMTLCQQGVTADLMFKVSEWYDRPLDGLKTGMYVPEQKEIASTDYTIETQPQLKIIVKQLFKLMGMELMPEDTVGNKAFYRKKPYAYILGAIVIDWNAQTVRMQSGVGGVSSSD